MKTKVCVECGRDFKISAEFYLREVQRGRHTGHSRCPRCRTGLEHMFDVVDYIEHVARRWSDRTSASDGVDRDANRK